MKESNVFSSRTWEEFLVALVCVSVCVWSMSMCSVCMRRFCCSWDMIGERERETTTFLKAFSLDLTISLFNWIWFVMSFILYLLFVLNFVLQSFFYIDKWYMEQWTHDMLEWFSFEFFCFFLYVLWYIDNTVCYFNCFHFIFCFMVTTNTNVMCFDSWGIYFNYTKLWSGIGL